MRHYELEGIKRMRGRTRPTRVLDLREHREQWRRHDPSICACSQLSIFPVIWYVVTLGFKRRFGWCLCSKNKGCPIHKAACRQLSSEAPHFTNNWRRRSLHPSRRRTTNHFLYYIESRFESERTLSANCEGFLQLGYLFIYFYKYPNNKLH